MLTELSISNSAGDSLSLPIPSGSDGYLVTEIEGLDPVPVAHATSTYAQLDGERYHASRREKRNIILHIKLKKNWWATTISYRRNRLYSLFVPKTEITLVFDTAETGLVYTVGRVETIDANMWTDEPFVIISILCFDPIFKSLTPTENTWVFSASTIRAINYLGNIETGISVEVVDWELEATAASNTIFTSYVGSAWPYSRTQIMSFSASLGQYDRLRFSSVPGEKYVKLKLVDNSIVSAINRLDTSSQWISLAPGANVFHATTSFIGARKYKLSYYTLYGGI